MLPITESCSKDSFDRAIISATNSGSLLNNLRKKLPYAIVLILTFGVPKVIQVDNIGTGILSSIVTAVICLVLIQFLMFIYRRISLALSKKYNGFAFWLHRSKDTVSLLYKLNYVPNEGVYALSVASFICFTKSKIIIHVGVFYSRHEIVIDIGDDFEVYIKELNNSSSFTLEKIRSRIVIRYRAVNGNLIDLPVSFFPLNSHGFASFDDEVVAAKYVYGRLHGVL